MQRENVRVFLVIFFPQFRRTLQCWDVQIILAAVPVQ